VGWGSTPVMSTTRHSTSSHSTPGHVQKDLGNLLKKFSAVTTDTIDPVKLSDVEAVASYSWINSKTPTIAVPGA
jgi:hypothetical protein